jgi:hypothetical protein
MRLYTRNLESRKFEGRSNDDIDFERNKEALTFKPEIKRTKFK